MYPLNEVIIDQAQECVEYLQTLFEAFGTYPLPPEFENAPVRVMREIQGFIEHLLVLIDVCEAAGDEMVELSRFSMPWGYDREGNPTYFDEENEDGEVSELSKLYDVYPDIVNALAYRSPIGSFVYHNPDNLRDPLLILDSMIDDFYMKYD
jgi:hypothetical protein